MPSFLNLFNTNTNDYKNTNENQDISSSNNNDVILGKTISETDVSLEIFIMIILLGFSVLISHLLKNFRIGKYLNESLCASLFGLFAGFILYITDSKDFITHINNAYTLFFLVIILPIIIFESAFNIKIHYFIKNIGSILIYAILGTLVSLFFISGICLVFSYFNFLDINFKVNESLAFGALISSTDPVSVLATFKEYDVDLNFYQLIFGESMLNDAVSIVFYEASIHLNNESSLGLGLLNMFGKFILVFVGSVLLGWITGYLTAFILKVCSKKEFKKMEKIEIGLVLLIPWISYLLATICHLSSIVCILFNGIAQCSYTKPYLTAYSKKSINSIYKVTANLFETLVFIFVGIGFFSFEPLYKNVNPIAPIVFIIIFILARFLNIVIMSSIINYPRRLNFLNSKRQLFLVFAGVRGSMAFALALKSYNDFEGNGEVFLIITLIFIAFTIIYSSFTTNFVIEKSEILNIEREGNSSALNEEYIRHPSENMFWFNRLRNYLINLNKIYLKKYVSRNNIDEENEDDDKNNNDNSQSEFEDNKEKDDNRKKNYSMMNFKLYSIDYQGGFSMIGN